MKFVYIFETAVGHRGILAETEIEARQIARSRSHYGQITLVKVEKDSEKGNE